MAERRPRSLEALVARALATGDDRPLADLLQAGSGLPGPRANLELASQFADAVASRGEAVSELWDLCVRWASIDAREAPANDPREFLPFCGIRGLGALAAAHPSRARAAMGRLRSLARDPRWRVREAVAMAIQDLARSRSVETARELRHWTAPGAWLEMRAVAAGVAEPTLLRKVAFARAALELHQRILDAVARAKDREGDAFRVLRQGLAYSVSVVVVGRPREGLAWFKHLARNSDPDVTWIVRENLRKNRLHKAFPRDVAAISARLERREKP